MASGIPVIGADAGGVGEMIQQRHTGLKFKPRNPKELIQCMKELMLDINLRFSLKENGRNYCMNRSWNKIFDALMDIYRETLLKRGMSTLSA